MFGCDITSGSRNVIGILLTLHGAIGSSRHNPPIVQAVSTEPLATVILDPWSILGLCMAISGRTMCVVAPESMTHSIVESRIGLGDDFDAKPWYARASLVVRGVGPAGGGGSLLPPVGWPPRGSAYLFQTAGGEREGARWMGS